MKLHIASLTFIVLILGVAAGLEAAQPVARILDAKGKIMLKDKNGKTREAAPLDTIYLGEKITVADDSFVVLAFRADGHLERVKRPLEVSVGKDGCEPKTSVELVEPPAPHKKLIQGTVKALQPKSVGGVTIVRGSPPDDAAPARFEPIDGSTIIGNHPKFAWSPVAKATRYEIKISAGAEKVWSKTTKKTELEYAGEIPLKPGVEYFWEVNAGFADGGSQHVNSGTFTPATEEQKNRAADLKAIAAGSEIPYLALAAGWYEENGFIPEAVGAYERLVSLRPNVAAYHFALAHSYEKANRSQEAQKAYAKARQLQPLPENPPLPDWQQEKD